MEFAVRSSVLIRWVAVIFWSAGLALIPFDRWYLFSMASENARLAYVLFLFAGCFCWWAEKREFGTRVMLYRLHDLAIASPWRYLLLYFLWVNLFAPFTSHPARSVLYACAGWFSLVWVALSAQLIFCVRGPRGIALIPSRLRFAFLAFNLSVLVFAGSYVAHTLLAGIVPIPQLSLDMFDTLLFFILGLPFLLWDFVNPKRQLLPRALVGTSVIMVFAAIFLFGNWIALFAALLAPVGILAIGLYKQIRLTTALAVISGLCLIGVNGVFLVTHYSQANPTQALRKQLETKQAEVESRIKRKLPEWEQIWRDLRESRFLGRGIGAERIDRGVWPQILTEVGLAGLLLYAGFFAALIRELWLIRSGTQIIAPNIALVSLGIFLLVSSHLVKNPYSTSIWVWYALWTAFSSTRAKREVRVISLAAHRELRELRL